MTCRSGDRCTEPVAEGSKFCVRHGEQLARIRAELEADRPGSADYDVWGANRSKDYVEAA